jgi:hypothetical protein
MAVADLQSELSFYMIQLYDTNWHLQSQTLQLPLCVVKISITVHFLRNAKYSPKVKLKNGNGHPTRRMLFTLSTSKYHF